MARSNEQKVDLHPVVVAVWCGKMRMICATQIPNGQERCFYWRCSGKTWYRINTGNVSNLIWKIVGSRLSLDKKTT
jgi:hypothetical protein